MDALKDLEERCAAAAAAAGAPSQSTSVSTGASEPHGYSQHATLDGQIGPIGHHEPQECPHHEEDDEHVDKEDDKIVAQVENPVQIEAAGGWTSCSMTTKQHRNKSATLRWDIPRTCIGDVLST